MKKEEIPITTLPLEKLLPDPLNPRQEFDPKTMSMLELSVSTYGIMQPLIVERREDGRFLVVDGERRYRTAKKLGLKEVPVRIEEAMSDLDRLARRFNLQEQHSQWSTFDKAIAVQNFQKATRKSKKDVATALGMSVSTIDDYFLVAILSKRTTTLAMEKKLPFDWLTEISRIVRNVNAGSQREQLEDALMDKVDRRVVVSVKELKKYRVAIEKEGKKILSNVITKPDYLPEQALADAEATYDLVIKNLYTHVHVVNSNLNRVIRALRDKEEVVVTSQTKYALEECKNLIKSLEELYE